GRRRRQVTRRDLLRGLGLLAPALLLLLPGVISAQGAASAGTVTRVSGHVIVSRGTSNEMSTLKFKDSLFDHDRIGTGERSSARLLRPSRTESSRTSPPASGLTDSGAPSLRAAPRRAAIV